VLSARPRPVPRRGRRAARGRRALARFGPKITLALGATVIALGFGSRIVFTGAFW